MKNLLLAFGLFLTVGLNAQTSISVGNYVGTFKQMNATNGNKSAKNTVKINAKTFMEDKTVGTVRYSTGCTADLIYKSNDGAGTFFFEERPIKSTDAGCECDGEIRLKANSKGDLTFTHVVSDMQIQGVLKMNSSPAPASGRN